METNQSGFSNKNTTDDFIYFNALGVLFNDKVILNNNRNVKLNITDIKRAVVKKERSFRWNMLILLVFIFLLGIFFYFSKQLTINDKIIIVVLSIIVLFSFFLIKEIKYKLIVFLDEGKIEIKVKKEDKEQAKKLISKINVFKTSKKQ